MSGESKKINLLKGCTSLILLIAMAMMFNITANAAIYKQPAPIKTKSVISSQSYREEYIQVRTPEKEKYVVYVSGKVKENVRRLCIRIEKHNGKVYITTFVKPNENGEFSIKINTKEGNDKVPKVIGKKGSVTKASTSYATRPGYRPVKKMTSGIYHLYVTAATTKKDAKVSKGSKWKKGTLGGSEGRIFKEAVMIINKKEPNNLKLIKYDEVITNNIEMRNQFEGGAEYIDSYNGSYVLYRDPYMKDIRFVFRNPLTKKYEMMTDQQAEYIEEISNTITENCKTPYQKGLEIYEYVAKNMYYDNYAYNKHEKQYSNPYQNLYKLNNKINSPNSKDGKVAITCQGFAAMVVALARAEGIPARFAYGRHIHQPKSVWTDLSPYELSLTTHYWPELYIEGKWIVADARGATRNQWVRESFVDKGRWIKKDFINYSHYHPTDELLSNSYIYNGIYHGSKDGKYLNKKHEFLQLRQFLEYKSEEGEKNGTKLNESYSGMLPSTWGNVEERDLLTDGYGNVTKIDWNNKELCGELNLTGFSELKKLNVYRNYLENIDLSDCTNLRRISATYNNLTEFDSSSCTKVVRLNLIGNKLYSAKFVHGPEIITIKSSEGGTFSIKYDKDGPNVLTINSQKPTMGYKYVGIYDEETGEEISTEKRYIFVPTSKSYEVRYEKRWVYKAVENLIKEIKEQGNHIFDSLVF